MVRPILELLQIFSHVLRRGAFKTALFKSHKHKQIANSPVHSAFLAKNWKGSLNVVQFLKEFLPQWEDNFKYTIG